MDTIATRQKMVQQGENITQKWIVEQLDLCLLKLKRQLPRFENKFPSACTTNMRYRIKDNDDWTNGFWTAMMWIAYEYSGETQFKLEAETQLESFEKRLETHYVLDHHDIGFLYSLSAYAGYAITRSEQYKNLTIVAAQKLAERFQKKGNFIQAWGALDNPTEYRLIIDSLLNLPLLFEASRLTGDSKLAEKADEHYHQVIANIIRSDGSTFHTFYFDRKTGASLKGGTHQGYSANSCWARGQAWILLGMPLFKKFHPNMQEQDTYQDVLQYYLRHLSADLIPYWDLTFTATDAQPKDSSAAAIVVNGLIAAQEQGYEKNGQAYAKGILWNLGQNYLTNDDQEGLLQHGVYAYAEKKGVDEANLWGDYFYMEALMRLYNPNWKTYW